MIGFTYNNKIQVKFNFDYDVFYCCGVMSLENVQNVKLLIKTLKKLKSLFSFMQKIILSDPTGQIIEFLIMIYVLGHSGVTYI